MQADGDLALQKQYDELYSNYLLLVASKPIDTSSSSSSSSEEKMKMSVLINDLPTDSYRGIPETTPFGELGLLQPGTVTT